MNEVLGLLKPILIAYSGEYGVIVQIMSIIGSLRTINKPLFSLLRAISEVTYWTERDNIWLDRVEQSKIYKTIIYVIDWVASAKIGRK